MRLASCRRRWARWLALLALVASTFAPSLSRFVIAATLSGGDWVEVCTPQGMRIVSASSRSGAADAAASSGSRGGWMIAGDVCPYCGTGVPMPAPPPAAGARPPPVSLRSFALPPLDARVAQARPLTAAAPRGPPTWS